MDTAIRDSIFEYDTAKDTLYIDIYEAPFYDPVHTEGDLVVRYSQGYLVGLTIHNARWYMSKMLRRE
jgi:uncharacterized protein YuzE